MEMIYHYTTLKAFMGMLHTPTKNELEEARGHGGDVDWAYYLNFHASDVRTMNDKRENSLIGEIITDMPVELKGHYNFVQHTLGPLYAISFCMQKDYIPMWRGYATDDFGICLCLSVDGFENKVKTLNNIPDDGDFRISECEYMRPSEMMKRKMEDLERLKELSKTTRFENEKQLWREVEKTIIESAFCKSVGFRYEQEVRLVKFSTRMFNIKKGRYGITTYLMLKIPISHLKEIVISPFSKDRDVAKYVIENSVRDRIYTETPLSKLPVDVEFSKFIM